MRLLLVEDDATLAEAVRRGLVDEGYGVDVAITIAQPDRATAENDYDVVGLHHPPRRVAVKRDNFI